MSTERVYASWGLEWEWWALGIEISFWIDASWGIQIHLGPLHPYIGCMMMF